MFFLQTIKDKRKEKSFDYHARIPIVWGNTIFFFSNSPLGPITVTVLKEVGLHPI